ncbi:MAG TPA: aminopeptidase P N-terminal domain-containing protein, partial [Thermoanaerobaculia bacterium]
MIAAAALLGLALAGAAPLTSGSVSAPPAIPPSFFAAHRDRFLAKLPAGSIAVFHAAAETTVESSPDPYRQSSDFWYLTGLSEPESVCVLVPASGGSAARYLLFVRPRDFEAEQWTGRRAGIEGAKKNFGAEAYSIAELWTRL